MTAAPNEAPSIGGTPSTSVEAGGTYQFQPSAQDPEDDALTFSISRKPAWASFATATGRLSGTPGVDDTGSYSGVIISVSDGSHSASLPAFSITVTAPQNAAPSISGTPSTSIAVGSPYQFQPTAQDPEGGTLAFSISRKPAWASFATASGRLSGTPDSTQAGDYSNIVISVSDGTNVAALPAFSIRVTAAAPPASGEARLSWDAPTQNTDGSALTNLVGYRIYHGTSVSSLTHAYEISGAGTTSFLYQGLASGTHYFAVAAFNSAGIEGAMTEVGRKTIP